MASALRSADLRTLDFVLLAHGEIIWAREQLTRGARLSEIAGKLGCLARDVDLSLWDALCARQPVRGAA